MSQAVDGPEVHPPSARHRALRVPGFRVMAPYAMPHRLSADSILRHLKRQAATLFALMALLWSAEVLDVVLRTISDIRMDAWGIRPRSLSGLKGIVLAPFLHVDFNHLAANSLPLLVLASLVLLEGPRRFWTATGLIALLSGAAVWCIGQSNSVYLGASGLIFGYLGFVFMRAWVSRQPVWIAIAVASALVYGGLAMSLLSVQQGVSWLGHSSGLLSGMLTATLLYDGIPRSRADR
jgi:membrane associated rhomboid family serine protease